MSLRFRKNELAFYKGSIPKELKKYLKENPSNTKYVEQFLNSYEYNYTEKKWVKRDKPGNFLDIFRKEDE